MGCFSIRHENVAVEPACLFYRPCLCCYKSLSLSSLQMFCHFSAKYNLQQILQKRKQISILVVLQDLPICYQLICNVSTNYVVRFFVDHYQKNILKKIPKSTKMSRKPFFWGVGGGVEDYINVGNFLCWCVLLKQK